MNNNNNNNILQKPQINSLEFSILAKGVINNFKKIVLINLIAAIIGVLFSLSLKNIYQSEIKLILKQEIQSPASGIGIALPINIGSSTGYEINFIRSVLSSRDFFKILYEDDSFIALTEGVQSYDEKNKKIVFDNKKIDKYGNWIIYNGNTLKPSFEKSFKNSKGYFSSSVDGSSGIVDLNFDHISPYQSMKLLNKTYTELNSYLKKLKLNEIDLRINFLRKSYSDANVQDIKTNISQLLKKEIEKKSIILSSENIYFDLIDSSSQGLRVAPKRSLIVLLILTISLALSMIYFMVRTIYDKPK